MRRRYSKESVEAAPGVAWFDREQWQRLREVAADPERLEESYEAWVAMAERAIRRLEAAGMLIERVPVDAEELIAWCKDRARPIDSSAEFAARQLRKVTCPNKCNHFMVGAPPRAGRSDARRARRARAESFPP